MSVGIDPRVNCMACLVADQVGVLENAVAAEGLIVHALARTAGKKRYAHHLCAFDASGVIKAGKYRGSRVEEENIHRLTETKRRGRPT